MGKSGFCAQKTLLGAGHEGLGWRAPRPSPYGISQRRNSLHNLPPARPEVSSMVTLFTLRSGWNKRQLRGGAHALGACDGRTTVNGWPRNRANWRHARRDESPRAQWSPIYERRGRPGEDPTFRWHFAWWITRPKSGWLWKRRDPGPTLVRATSGREALRLVLRRDFAVILLDSDMRGMDGFKTAALLRHRKSSAHPPIISSAVFRRATAPAGGSDGPSRPSRRKARLITSCPT
ncbi:MAG: hypothetical protein RIQ93_34 [Verrucomicrobiota bacterium]|jgi:hypothetical protein